MTMVFKRISWAVVLTLLLVLPVSAYLPRPATFSTWSENDSWSFVFRGGRGTKGMELRDLKNNKIVWTQKLPDLNPRSVYVSNQGDWVVMTRRDAPFFMLLDEMGRAVNLQVPDEVGHSEKIRFLGSELSRSADLIYLEFQGGLHYTLDPSARTILATTEDQIREALDGDPENWALNFALRTKPEGLRGRFQELAADDSEYTRAAALAVLGAMGDESARTTLLQGMRNPDESERPPNGIYYIKRVWSPEKAKSLLLEFSRDEHWRYDALEALVGYGAEAVPELLQVMQEADRNVAGYVFEELRKIDPPDRSAGLLKAWQGGSKLRWLFAEYFAEYEFPDAIPALVEALDRAEEYGDPEIKGGTGPLGALALARALSFQTGINLPPEKAVWERYLAAEVHSLSPQEHGSLLLELGDPFGAVLLAFSGPSPEVESALARHPRLVDLRDSMGDHWRLSRDGESFELSRYGSYPNVSKELASLDPWILPNGKGYVSVADGRASHYSPQGQIIRAFDLDEATKYTELRFSSDGSLLLTKRGLWNLPTGSQILSFSRGTGQVCFSADELSLAVLNYNDSVQFFSVQGEPISHPLKETTLDAFGPLILTKTHLIGNDNEKLHFQNLKTKAIDHTLTLSGHIGRASMDEKEERLGIITYGGEFKIWNLHTHEWEKIVPGERALDDDGQILLRHNTVATRLNYDMRAWQYQAKPELTDDPLELALYCSRWLGRVPDGRSSRSMTVEEFRSDDVLGPELVSNFCQILLSWSASLITKRGHSKSS